MADNKNRSLESRTVRGMLWAYGAYVGGRAVVLISTAILAHILIPAEFGVVAVALVFMTFLETVKDMGLTQALIMAPPEEEATRAQTTFIWTVTIGLVLALAASGVGQLAAGFFGHEELRAIIPVLALTFVIESLGSTHDSLARKRLDYRTRAIAQGAEVIMRAATGITLALSGFGAWSLVLGYLVGATVRTTTLWTLVKFRPRLRYTRQHLGSLIRFGSALTLVDIVAALTSNIDYIFVGRVLGAASLGLYLIGFRLPELLIMNLAVVASDVLFPAFAELRKDQLEYGLLTSLRYLAAMAVPTAVGLALLARPVVLALFGPKWHGSIEVMQVLAAFAAITAINIPAGTIYKVSGRAWILVAMSVPYFTVLFITLLLFTERGILAAALCMTVTVAVGALIAVVVAGRILAVPLHRIGRAIMGPVAAALAMGVPVFAVERVVRSPWPALIVGVIVAALVYGLLLRLLAPDITDRVIRLVTSRLLGRPPMEPAAAAPADV